MKDDERTKELIAIGASVGAHCQPCLEYHIAKARELGISEKCIKTAIEIGFMVENGSSDAMHSFVDEILSKADERSKEEANGASGCCG